jgi:hypothetical protein
MTFVDQIEEQQRELSFTEFALAVAKAAALALEAHKLPKVAEEDELTEEMKVIEKMRKENLNV